MRKCIIMSGPSGSGKSTWIRNQAWYKSANVFSADFFFGAGAAYKFDPSKLPQAHAECLRGFIEACQDGLAFPGNYETIVVDNTNTTIEEIAPYYSIAKAYWYEVELVTMQVEPHIAAGRNLHGVPMGACKAMHERINARIVPRFWDIKLSLVPGV